MGYTDQEGTDLNAESTQRDNYGNNLDYNGIPLLIQSNKLKPHLNGGGTVHGATLAWKEVSVYIPVKKSGYFGKPQKHQGFKRVLNNVSGVVYPGSLTGIMGASGAGKTTLLSTLGYKANADVKMSGEILVNGRPVGPFIEGMSGYIYQADLFVGTLTVSEHLHFMASLKLDSRVGPSERRRRVEELLVDLSLKKCENTRIGIPGEQTGISGGERKRLAFAAEILTNPSLLFCDEPTSGLDSYSAMKIIGILKDMASQGKTILCTIHQPSPQLFSLFDQFCILAEGRNAFMGKSDEALAFFNKLNYQCPPHHNLGDFYIRTLSVFPGKEVESRMNIKKICDSFSKSEEAEKIDERIQDEILRGGKDDGYFRESHHYPSWFFLTGCLIWRSVINTIRNPKTQFVKIIQKIVLAFIIGFCYLGIPLNQDGIQNVQGVIYLMLTESSFPSCYGALHLFPTEFPLFLREHKAGLYRTSSYYLGKLFSLIPSLSLEGIIFTSIAYWLVGLRLTLNDFLITSLVVILTANIAGACGCFFSAACDTLDMAILLLMPIDYIVMVSGGQFMNLGSLPVYVSWVKYISWFMYSNEAISIVQWREISNITCGSASDDHCIGDGVEVLHSRSFDESHLMFDFTGLVSLLVIFHLGTYFALRRKAQK